MTPAEIDRLDALYAARMDKTGDAFAEAHYGFTRALVDAWPAISAALRIHNLSQQDYDQLVRDAMRWRAQPSAT